MEEYETEKKCLESISLENLIRRLNSMLHNSEGYLELQDLYVQDARNGFLPNNMAPVKRGGARIVQNVFGGNLWDILVDNQSELYIGKIEFEKGVLEDSSAYGGRYEKIKLRINDPLKLKEGNILPPCKIRLTVESEDTGIISKEREDYICRFLGRKKADLSKLLPTEYFIGG